MTPRPEDWTCTLQVRIQPPAKGADRWVASVTLNDTEPKQVDAITSSRLNAYLCEAIKDILRENAGNRSVQARDSLPALQARLTHKEQEMDALLSTIWTALEDPSLTAERDIQRLGNKIGGLVAEVRRLSRKTEGIEALQERLANQKGTIDLLTAELRRARSPESPF